MNAPRARPTSLVFSNDRNGRVSDQTARVPPCASPLLFLSGGVNRGGISTVWSNPSTHRSIPFDL